MLTYSTMLIDRFLPREHRDASTVFFASISRSFRAPLKKAPFLCHRFRRRILSSHVQAPDFDITLRAILLLDSNQVQRQKYCNEKKSIIKNKCSTSQNIAIAPYENMDKSFYRGIEGNKRMAENQVKNLGYGLRILPPFICLPVQSIKNNTLAQTIFWISSNPIALVERYS